MCLLWNHKVFLVVAMMIKKKNTWRLFKPLNSLESEPQFFFFFFAYINTMSSVFRKLLTPHSYNNSEKVIANETLSTGAHLFFSCLKVIQEDSSSQRLQKRLNSQDKSYQAACVNLWLENKSGNMCVCLCMGFEESFIHMEHIQGNKSKQVIFSSKLQYRIVFLLLLCGFQKVKTNGKLM